MMTPLHYLVGGFIGLFVEYLLQGQITWMGGIFAFIAWPIVVAFGILVLIMKAVGYIFGLIF